MKTEAAIHWFKTNFQKTIDQAVAGTPFSLDLVTAIAMQETSYIWMGLLDKGMGAADVLRLCVGDTLDADKGRSAFPKTKADLLKAARGQEMFDIARQALLDMAAHVPGYGFAKKRKDKFCHGFGIFQYDLQFYKTDPDYFLTKGWEDFGRCLGKCIEELHAALKRQGWQGKGSLTEHEKVYVAIAYNAGSARLSKGFKQGHKDDNGRFYGEGIWEYMNLAAKVSVTGGAAPVPVVNAGVAPLPEPTPVATGANIFEVDVKTSPLKLRREPKVPAGDRDGNVLAQLPDGLLVNRVSGKKGDEWLEVEVSLNGAYFRGYAAAKYLKATKEADEVPVVEVASEDPTTGVVAAHLPNPAGVLTKRTGIAAATSLNEAGQPGRKGATAADRCAEIAAIIAWLAVDRATHRRYAPRDGLTFCNIYAHDFCRLAGVYLPRVWWTGPALVRLAGGGAVAPKYGSTVDEVRANDLFRWLRDYGPRFGWRQTGTLSKLQESANLGGIGIIVARRTEDGRSGHIVAVAPETTDERAKRNAAGEVTAPLQSQAGSVNFRYGTGRTDWWLGAQFAASAFWIHA